MGKHDALRTVSPGESKAVALGTSAKTQSPAVIARSFIVSHVASDERAIAS